VAAHFDCTWHFVCDSKQLLRSHRSFNNPAVDFDLAKAPDLENAESFRHNSSVQRNMEIRSAGQRTAQMVYAQKVDHGQASGNHRSTLA